MNKYQKYKNSGVQWLGEIPEHWEILPSKRYFYYKKEINKNYISDNVLSLTLRGVVNNDIENPEGLVPKDYATYQYFEKDNLVFKLIDLENVSTSRVGIVHENGIMSSAYIRLISGSKIFNKYAYYFYFSLYKNQVFNKLGSGVRSTLNPTDLLNLSFVKPPLSEQTAIANFLDDKTAKIDQAIAIKEKEITLLKERRQILIQKAVTKGLDATVLMKPSGVDWIGEIPAHWDCIKLKFLGNAIIGLTYSPNDLCDSTEGKLVLRSSNLFEGRFVYGEKENAYVKTKIPEKLMIRENDILICSRNGSRDLIGKCAIAKSEDVGSSFGAFTTVFRSKYNQYLFCILNSNIFKNLSGSFLTSTINQLTIGNLYSIQVPIPPENEMSQIRIYVTSIESKIAKAITLKEQEIEKLKEYKTVLIDNVVTGKVRVS